MTRTIQSIAEAIGARAEGNLGLCVSGASEPSRASSDQLAMAMSPDFAALIGQGAAKAAMLWDDADWQSYGVEAAILVARPRYAMAGVTELFDHASIAEPGIHPSAVVHPSAVIGEQVSIGPLCVIEAEAKIGAHSQVGPQVHIGQGASIGAYARIHAGAKIGRNVTIGENFIAQPGAVVGGDGFSFVTPEPDAVEAVRSTLGDRTDRQQQAYARIHSLAAVTLGDDVEIGANASIDRGTLVDTKIGRGTKIDSLVQVGHNAEIGEDCLLCGQVGIAGSTKIGNRVVLGGQVGVTDHLKIGNDVIAGAGTLIRTNQSDGKVLLGNPAMDMSASIEAYKGLRRLPRLFAQVATLRKALSKQSETD